VLTGNFLLLFLYLGCTTRGAFQLDISFICLLRVISTLLAKEFDGVGYRKSGDTTVVKVQTNLEACLNMSQNSDCFNDEAPFFPPFFYFLAAALLKSRIIRISRLLDTGLREFCCAWKTSSPLKIMISLYTYH
jgi:hypothetical protein